MIKFRRGFESDIPKLARLWFDMVRESQPSFHPNILWWKLETQNHMRINGNYFMFVAEEGGAIIAFTDGYMHADPAQGKLFFFSRHSFVRQSYRHTNIIKELYHMVTEEARARGARDLMFGCSDSTKPMWESHGYHQIEYIMTGPLHDIPSTMNKPEESFTETPKEVSHGSS